MYWIIRKYKKIPSYLSLQIEKNNSNQFNVCKVRICSYIESYIPAYLIMRTYLTGALCG